MVTNNSTHINKQNEQPSHLLEKLTTKKTTDIALDVMLWLSTGTNNVAGMPGTSRTANRFCENNNNNAVFISFSNNCVYTNPINLYFTPLLAICQLHFLYSREGSRKVISNF